MPPSPTCEQPCDYLAALVRGKNNGKLKHGIQTESVIIVEQKLSWSNKNSIYFHHWRWKLCVWPELTRILPAQHIGHKTYGVLTSIWNIMPSSLPNMQTKGLSALLSVPSKFLQSVWIAKNIVIKNYPFHSI